MGYVEFLQGLLEEGRVSVTSPAPIPKAELGSADAILAAFEERYRQEIPGEPPPLDLSAARWAGANFYHACRFAVHRDAEATTLQTLVQLDFASTANAAAHYSVDLVFRFLPDLMRIARQAVSDDPLVERLQHWACCWPLSSVGMDLPGTIEIAPIVGCPSLLLLYVDRIFATGDQRRLQDKRVAEAARCAVGAYPELAGRLAPLLTTAPVPFL